MAKKATSIELLSPARDLGCGVAAVSCGTDAVYIGATAFGARAAAGNSIADIEKLVKYAHQYRVKVYVTLNTILKNSELEEAQQLSWQVYEAGADALIIQDLGLTMLDLPPIPLHASTQTDNRTIEKVRFLQQNGFSRVVLARELSLAQIAEIKQNTDIELEVFAHGALCVSASGQCYISQAMCGRSANRGECAQYCRLSYDLVDNQGNMLVKNKYLLSLRDLDVSAHLPELLTAGVSSFKIEGRLKDADYVKNITAFYRRKLDAIFEQDKHFCAASSGKTTFFFEPNPKKTFHRGATNFFLYGQQPSVIQPNTPKSTGEQLGKVSFISKNYFEIHTNKTLHNGDGLCFFDKNDDLQGFRVNRIENGKIFPQQFPDIQAGTELFRNQDIAFEKQLKGKTAERKIAMEIIFSQKEKSIEIQAIDTDGISSTLLFETENQPASKPETARQNIENQFNKLGDTIFELKNMKIVWNTPLFFPASVLAKMRRQTIENHEIKREKTHIRQPHHPSENAPFYQNSLDYTANVANDCARAFYEQRGVTEIAPAFELQPPKNVPLMFCRHCIKYEMGWCARQKSTVPLHEPLFLVHGNQRFPLQFDCAKCEMHLLAAS